MTALSMFSADMAAHVFHVEFGMNDTPLTHALKARNYAKAKQLILAHSQSSYLDEGEELAADMIIMLPYVCFWS